MANIRSFTFNPFQTNCIIAWNGHDAAIVDPSCRSASEIQAVTEFVRENRLRVRHLLLTHAHVDHVFGCAELAEAFALPVTMHRDDLRLLEEAPFQARMFGVEMQPLDVAPTFFSEGDRIRTGSLEWEVLHTPGHSPGSVTFVDRENRYAIVGDVLFRGSIGRTDLWRGSLPELMRSIFEKILPLGDNFVVHPGHGPTTTVGAERESNPFLTGEAPVDF